MEVKNFAPEHYRFERKFAVPKLDSEELEMAIRLHPAFFKEIYYQRSVNNIYFDSYDLKNYNENVHGIARRLKVRVRWYGDLFGEVEKPNLELKIKSGLLGRKETYKMENFNFSENFEVRELMEIFQNAQLPDHIHEELKELRPTLLNRYQRKYFMSYDKVFRVTLDTNMEFYSLKTFSEQMTKKVVNDEYNVIELKYAFNKEDEANKITSLFPFRVTKSSKYVDGIDRLRSVF